MKHQRGFSPFGGVLRRRTHSLMLGLAALWALAVLLPAGAIAGGANIGSAPVVPFGVQQFGNTGAGHYDCGPAEFWMLSLRAGDQVTIDWEAASRDYANELFVYPAGTTDFSINNASALQVFSIGENAHGEGIIQVGTAGSYPLIFAARGCDEDHHAGPYDFTARVQHGLLASLKNYANIRTTTVISGAAVVADGAPVPDGLVFGLTVSWHGPSGVESASYAAATVAGTLSFPLALPETAMGKRATLILGRPADAQYLEAKGMRLQVKVGRGAAEPQSTPCDKATAHAHSLARQFKRLRYHSLLAKGNRRRRIRNRAMRVHRALKVARKEAARACAAA